MEEYFFELGSVGKEVAVWIHYDSNRNYESILSPM